MRNLAPHSLTYFLTRVVSRFVLPAARSVYAQSGEDLILSHLFTKLGVARPTYLDIGANEPRKISNTYFFYLRGSRGVCVEPNPVLAQAHRRIRPRDTVLNVGIGVTDTPGEADFYVYDGWANGLSTFSAESVQFWRTAGVKGIGPVSHERTIRMPLVPINTILGDYFSTAAPDLISLDVEGLDLAILRALDFSRHAPRVLCVETLDYDAQQHEVKDHAITAHLIAQGYEVYADTRVNTIYVRQGAL